MIQNEIDENLYQKNFDVIVSFKIKYYSENAKLYCETKT